MQALIPVAAHRREDLQKVTPGCGDAHMSLHKPLKRRDGERERERKNKRRKARGREGERKRTDKKERKTERKKAREMLRKKGGCLWLCCSYGCAVYKCSRKLASVSARRMGPSAYRRRGVRRVKLEISALVSTTGLLAAFPSGLLEAPPSAKSRSKAAKFKQSLHAPNVPLLRALWYLLDGIWPPYRADGGRRRPWGRR